MGQGMTQRMKKIEFGDFQTPAFFARAVCKKLSEGACRSPQSVIEPTCGKGHFLSAATQEFKSASRFLGFEINANYVAEAEQLISSVTNKPFSVTEADFFDLDWGKIVADLPTPIMFIGNPPWVTNSTLGALSSDNLPEKDNFHKFSGLAALTGKSNFDISEWMILQLLGVIQKTEGVVAMLCKTSVARKVLQYAKGKNRVFSGAQLYHMNSKELFNAAVDACLFVFSSCDGKRDYTCKVYSELSSSLPVKEFGFVANGFVADVSRYNPLFDLASADTVSKKTSMKWRSGIKHDCSSVMELYCEGSVLRNGKGESVDVETEFVFPLLKSSDLNQDEMNLNRKKVIVTQKFIGEEYSVTSVESSEAVGVSRVSSRAFSKAQKFNISKSSTVLVVWCR